jgi:hypothetical protein
MAFVGYCVARYFYPFLGICALIFEFTPHHSVGSQQSKVLSVFCGLVLCLIPVYIRVMTRRAFYRSRIGSGDCTIDFNPELIRTSGPNSKSEIKWSAIQSFNEDGNAFLLYLAPSRFLIIPKRACSAKQIDELRSLLVEKIKPESNL